jgi:hypothetical protein
MDEDQVKYRVFLEFPVLIKDTGTEVIPKLSSNRQQVEFRTDIYDFIIGELTDFIEIKTDES